MGALERRGGRDTRSWSRWLSGQRRLERAAYPRGDRPGLDSANDDLPPQHDVQPGGHELELLLRFFEMRPTRSVRSPRSTVTICETLATESLDSPALLAAMRTLPGASALFTLLVSGTHTTVATRLWLKASP